MNTNSFVISRALPQTLLPSKVRERDSGMELLRIVAMSMILCGHFVHHGLGIFDKTIYGLTTPFFISGINLFFFISGWYGIRFSVRSFVRMIVTVCLFSLISVGLLATQGVYVTFPEICEHVFWPISKSGYWFVAVYMLLFIVSPVLNRGLDPMTRRQTGVCVLLMTIICVFGGYFAGNYVNVTGKSFAQAVWLYVTARWLHENMSVISRINRNWWLVIFLASKVLLIILLFRNNLEDKMFYDNNPLTVAACLSLFLYFAQLRFRSMAVNVMAMGVFGCYLLQDGLFGHKFMYAQISDIYGSASAAGGVYEGLLHAVAACAVAFVGIWCASLILTPIVDRISRWAGMMVDKMVRRLQK